MTDTTASKVRENRLRRMAKRRGLELKKSPRRDTLAIDFNGFMLVDAATNAVVLGAGSWAFDASLDDVEQFLSDPRAIGALFEEREANL